MPRKGTPPGGRPPAETWRAQEATPAVSGLVKGPSGAQGQQCAVESESAHEPWRAGWILQPLRWSAIKKGVGNGHVLICGYRQVGGDTYPYSMEMTQCHSLRSEKDACRETASSTHTSDRGYKPRCLRGLPPH